MPLQVPFYDAPTSTILPRPARYYPRSIGAAGLFDASCGCRPWWYLLIAAGVGIGVGVMAKGEKKKRPRKRG